MYVAVSLKKSEALVALFLSDNDDSRMTIYADTIVDLTRIVSNNLRS